jgi:hypothetical protein
MTWPSAHITDIVTASFIPILPAVSIYYKDAKRKAQQDTTCAYQHLQTETDEIYSHGHTFVVLTPKRDNRRFL